jgi:hypothetical protein
VCEFLQRSGLHRFVLLLRLAAGHRAPARATLLDYGAANAARCPRHPNGSVCEDETFPPEVCLVSIGRSATSSSGSLLPGATRFWTRN